MICGAGNSGGLATGLVAVGTIPGSAAVPEPTAIGAGGAAPPAGWTCGTGSAGTAGVGRGIAAGGCWFVAVRLTTGAGGPAGDITGAGKLAGAGATGSKFGGAIGPPGGAAFAASAAMKALVVTPPTSFAAACTFPARSSPVTR